MNDAQKEWYRKYSESFGVREFFRFGIFLALWVILGVVVMITFENEVFFYIFFSIPFAFAVLAPRWKPTYSLLRKLLGNENLPLEPYPGPFTIWKNRPWWSYLLSAWWIVMILLLFFIIREP